MSKIVVPREWILSKLNDKEYFDSDYALAQLLLDNVVFYNDGLLCNANDVFAWGFSDCEEVKDTVELEELWRMHDKDPKWGSVKWCCKKRKMFPQKPVLDDIIKDNAWDVDDSEFELNWYSENLKRIIAERKAKESGDAANADSGKAEGTDSQPS